jgi:hypothetical protein
MASAIRRYIAQLACSPSQPAWSALTPEQRALSAFATVMSHGEPAAMRSLIWSVHARTLAVSLRRLGVEWLAKFIISLSLSSDNIMTGPWLGQQCRRLNREREALWRRAEAYVIANGLPSLRQL